MHYWGDEWFEKNGNDFYHAIDMCTKVWRKYGRIGTHGKEKYGTFRDQLIWWDGGLYYLIYPGYMYIKNRFLYFKLDKYIFRPFFKYTLLNKLINWYQRQIYNFMIQRMCKKYPNIIDELVCDLDGYKMVKPGIFGKVDGEVIYNKYWKSI